MSGHDYTGTYTTGVTLTNPNNNPVTVSAGATIANPTGAALHSTLALDWTIGNSGLIQSTGTTYGATGIALAAGGTITNQQPGRIVGYDVGISVAGTATVLNQGAINATQTKGTGYSYNTVTGITPLSGGVIMTGGAVTNASSATITSYLEGVAIGAGGSVVNAGSIGAGSTKYGFGIFLPGGGSVSNAATGIITAGRDAVIALGATASTVTNHGVIAATRKIGVDLEHGGFVNNTGTITGGYDAIATGGTTPSTVTNSGILNGTNIFGVILNSGGYLSNAATGTITGVYNGVKLSGAVSSIVNLGSISSSQTIAGPSFDPAGVDLVAGGTVTNGVSGNIRATWKGVEIGSTTAFTAGTLLNQGFVYAYGRITKTPSGTIISAGAAVWIHGVADISNATTGTIAGGPFGVVLYADAQIINRGTIHGSEYAIFEKYVGDSVRLINYPDAVLSGIVEGSNPAGPASGILELASGAATGTIAAFGGKYIGFSNITLDAGAAWSFGGTVTTAQHLAFNGPSALLELANPQAMAGTIAGFSFSDTIALTGITDVTAVTLSPSHLLTISRSTGPTLALQFDPAQTFTQHFNYAVSGTATNLTLACFAAGTRIRSGQGLVPVEALRPGTRIPTHFSRIATVVWVGHRHIDCRRHPNPRDVWPIRIRANAFASGQPAVDLYLSPDHAIYLNDVLIPIRHLINNTTIQQVPRDTVAYYHVELPRHDVLLAEGLAVESYLDIGDRANFANGSNTVRLFADFSAPPRDPRALWDANACAPLIVHGPQLDTVRRRHQQPDIVPLAHEAGEVQDPGCKPGDAGEGRSPRPYPALRNTTRKYR